MTGKGTIYIIAAAVLWGILPAVSSGLNHSGIDPLTSAAFRATLAAFVFLLSSMIWKRGSLRIRLRDIPFFMVYGLFCVVGMYCFYFLAIEQSTISMAAILLYTAPAFVIILSRAFFKESLGGKKLLALAAAFLGCFLVVKGYDAAALRANWLGILFGLASGLSYAMLSILGKVGLARYSAWTNMMYTLVFGTLFIWFIRPPWVLFSHQYSSWEWGGFWVLAVVCTVVPNTLYVSGLRDMEAGLASINATLEPVVAALTSIFVFSESFEGVQAAGMLLVLLGIAAPLLPTEAITMKNHAA